MALVAEEQLTALCVKAGKPNVLIRIACRELEAWFMGDLHSVGKEFKRPNLSSLAAKKKYRSPDTMHKPSDELARLVPGYRKVSGARLMGKTIPLDGSRSHSFRVFVSGIRRIVEEANL